MYMYKHTLALPYEQLVLHTFQEAPWVGMWTCATKKKGKEEKNKGSQSKGHKNKQTDTQEKVSSHKLGRLATANLYTPSFMIYQERVSDRGLRGYKVETGGHLLGGKFVYGFWYYSYLEEMPPSANGLHWEGKSFSLVTSCGEQYHIIASLIISSHTEERVMLRKTVLVVGNSTQVLIFVWATAALSTVFMCSPFQRLLQFPSSVEAQIAAYQLQHSIQDTLDEATFTMAWFIINIITPFTAWSVLGSSIDVTGRLHSDRTTICPSFPLCTYMY